MDTIHILYSEIYYDQLYEKYYNILTLNKEPLGELKKYTKLLRITNSSTKGDTYNGSYCSYAISGNLSNTSNNINVLTLDQLDDFTQFIINNNYSISNEITQIYKNVLYNNKRIIYAFLLK